MNNLAAEVRNAELDIRNYAMLNSLSLDVAASIFIVAELRLLRYSLVKKEPLDISTRPSGSKFGKLT